MLIPLLENGELLIPGHSDSLKVAPGFQFFATRRYVLLTFYSSSSLTPNRLHVKSTIPRIEFSGEPLQAKLVRTDDRATFLNFDYLYILKLINFSNPFCFKERKKISKHDSQGQQ